MHAACTPSPSWTQNGSPLFLRRTESFPGRALIGCTSRHDQIRNGQPVRHALLKIGEHVIVCVGRHHEGEARAGVLAEFDNEASAPVGADDVYARMVDRGSHCQTYKERPLIISRMDGAGSRAELTPYPHVSGPSDGARKLRPYLAKMNNVSN